MKTLVALFILIIFSPLYLIAKSTGISETYKESKSIYSYLKSAQNAYTHKRFDLAIENYGKTLLNPKINKKDFKPKIHYNIGNALFRKGELLLKKNNENETSSIDFVINQWKEAIEHYEYAFSKNKKPHIKHNIDIVKKKIKELEKKKKKSGNEKNQENKSGNEKNQENKSGNEKNQENKSNNNDEKENKTEDKDLKGKISSISNNDSKSKYEPKDTKKNSETGYSPSDARNIIKNLSDETKVKTRNRSRNRIKNYKDW